MYNYSNHNHSDYLFPNNNIDNNLFDYDDNNNNMSNYCGQNMMMPSSFNLNYSSNLFNSYDGFVRGNMFTDLYQPYIVGEPFNLKPQNERESLLNKVREYAFAMIDLNLYLDTHPDDVEKINTFNQYRLMHEQAVNEFESRYGPLTMCSEALNSYPWAWLTPPWPWEGR